MRTQRRAASRAIHASLLLCGAILLRWCSRLPVGNVISIVPASIFRTLMDQLDRLKAARWRHAEKKHQQAGFDTVTEI